MRLKPKTEGQCIIVPAEPVLKKLGECNGTKLRVLLWALANPEFDVDEACEHLDITKRSFMAAVEYWQEQNVFEKTEKTKKTPSKTTTPKESEKVAENVTVRRPKAVMSASQLPKYTSDEVASYIESHAGMQDMLNSCQQYVGKLFTASETETVVGLMDYLKLDEAYILLLFSYCEKIGKRSLRYIERFAVELFDKGVMEYDQLETYLMVLDRSNKLDAPLRKLFGVGNRSFTKKEKDIIENWFKWEVEFNVIEKAYEITVENTGGASIPYCNAVLTSWHNKGYKTVDEINADMEKYKHDKEGAKDKKGSFETDDYFEAALRRSYGGDSASKGQQ